MEIQFLINAKQIRLKVSSLCFFLLPLVSLGPVHFEFAIAQNNGVGFLALPGIGKFMGMAFGKHTASGLGNDFSFYIGADPCA